MSLQKKIVVVFIVLGAVFSLGSYAGLTTFVFPAFEDFEQESATQNLVRMRRAIDAELHSLDIVNREYSEWDHTYEYALGRRDDYVAENLDIAYWNNVDINMMLFFDLDGEMIWGSIVDRSVRIERPVADELLQALTADHPLLHHRGDPGVTLGFLQTRSAPMMVASQPILTSAAQGPTAGTLVIGKYLDETRVNELAERASVDVAIHLLSDQSVPRDYKAALANPVGEDIATHWTYDENTVSGFQAITDVFGIPAFVLEVGTPKKITGIGHNTINTALVFFVIATVISLLTAWLFTRNLIVTPVTSLTRHILRIKKTGNFDEPIESMQNDEVGVLAQEFGTLATSLGAAQRELESARDQALAISNAKSDFLARMSHEIRTPMNGVLGMIELLNSTPLTRTQMSYARSSQEAARTLLDIINDVLDFSKIEAGKLRLETVRFAL
ncbi:MAG: HAMP domain-containing protein, partial [Gammaproteobacteria bacterium]|nr:HAMP domain-containing protein [Gammaproteobacteria bacterium]